MMLMVMMVENNVTRNDNIHAYRFYHYSFIWLSLIRVKVYYYIIYEYMNIIVSLPSWIMNCIADSAVIIIITFIILVIITMITVITLITATASVINIIIIDMMPIINFHPK